MSCSSPSRSSLNLPEVRCCPLGIDWKPCVSGCPAQSTPKHQAAIGQYYHGHSPLDVYNFTTVTITTITFLSLFAVDCFQHFWAQSRSLESHPLSLFLLSVIASRRRSASSRLGIFREPTLTHPTLTTRRPSQPSQPSTHLTHFTTLTRKHPQQHEQCLALARSLRPARITIPTTARSSTGLAFKPTSPARPMSPPNDRTHPSQAT